MHFFRFTNIFSRYLLFTLLLWVEATGNIVLTEILSNPHGSESECPGGDCLEYIEFTNLGCTALSLHSLLLTDGTTTDSIVAWEEPIPWHQEAVYDMDSLSCGQSLLILDRDYLDTPPAYRLAVKGKPVICTVNHSSLLGMLTDTRGLLLYRGDESFMQDSLYALCDEGQEISLHQKIIFTPDAKSPEGSSRIPSFTLFQNEEWQMCADPTPGYIVEDNLRWITEHKVGVNRAGTPLCSIAVFDRYASNRSHFSLSLLDQNGRNISDVHRIDQCLFFLNVELPSDIISARLKISATEDYLESNLDLSDLILPRYSLRITEIAPRKNSFTEWIELINICEAPINLKNFSINTSEDSFPLSVTSVIIEPSCQIVLARCKETFLERYPLSGNILQPEDWESLDDYRDTLYLKHSTGLICDSVIYDQRKQSGWDGGSLQRIDPAKPGTDKNNWVVSNDATPGLPNRNPKWRNNSKPSMSIGPSPFTPNGDGKNDKLLICVSLPPGYDAELAIYSFDGVLRYERPRIDEQRFLWDGKDNYGKPAPAGPFFAVLTIRSDNRAEKIIEKGILWR